MKSRTGQAAASLVVGAALFGACTHRPPAIPAPAPAPSDLVVLLGDPDDGHLGAAMVTTPAGAVELTMEHGATRVVAGQAPSPQAAIADGDVQRIFGDALAARPPAPRQFLLYFQTGGDVLTPESQALLPQIVAFVRGRATADVTVIGHTDTTGTAPNNTALGLRRAILIRDQLLTAGLTESQVDYASHGEMDLLVATADNVAEPRNRRVEVSVR